MEILKPYISIIVLLGFVITPLCSYAQRSLADQPEYNEISQAHADAITDAQHDTDTTCWFGIGCMSIFLGVFAAYLIVPSPGYERLLGKSIVYVKTYQESYRSKRRSLQTRYAIYGCLAIMVAGSLSMIGLALMQDELTGN
jgi:hypothetical protein